MSTPELPTPCAECGYELRGLPSEGMCPECGASIAASLARRSLGLAAPHYVRSLRTGTDLTLWALALFGVAGLARTYLGHAQGFAAVGIGIDCVAAGLLLAGTWMLTPDDPGLHPQDQARPNKRAMRAGAVGILATALLLFILILSRSAGRSHTSLFPDFSAIFEVAFWLVWATGMANYTRWIAVRLPDNALYNTGRRTGRALPWTIAVWFMISFLFGAAPRVLPMALLFWLSWRVRDRIGRSHV
ncbi:MAG: hypothetical protein U0573_02360 [Phycisphaerales bacterium]|nr:hypothetical protein [Planctomycetota bacterium]